MSVDPTQTNSHWPGLVETKLDASRYEEMTPERLLQKMKQQTERRYAFYSHEYTVT